MENTNLSQKETKETREAKNTKEPGRRYAHLDDIRGITLISMILYHTVWDLVYLFDVDWQWFRTGAAYVWQQSICWVFIALSGYCWSLGSHQKKRGMQVFVAGVLVSLVTEIVTPNQRICFGVLTFLGTAMLFMVPLEKYLQKIAGKMGLVFCCIAFFLLRGVNDGYIGFEDKLVLHELPEALYHTGYVGTFIGFTDMDFYSADYFSLLPWIFLFMAGYFWYRVDVSRGELEKKAGQKSRGRFFNMLGRHSLVIYLLHQPLIYGVLLVMDWLQVI